MDNEIKGEGNSLNYTLRMHDPRVGRFLSLDPLADNFPWNSPYAFSENRVIDAVELEGGESKKYLINLHDDEPKLKLVWSRDSWFIFAQTDIEVQGLPNGETATFRFTPWGQEVNNNQYGVTGQNNFLGDIDEFKKNPVKAISEGKFSIKEDVDKRAMITAAATVIIGKALKIRKSNVSQSKQTNRVSVKNSQQNKTALVTEKKATPDIDDLDGVQKVNGRSPINSKYAGKTFTFDSGSALAKKYAKGVPFTKSGFPNFSAYAKKTVDIGKLNKSSSTDFAAANKAAGYSETPANHTWHHVENSTKLQLVPTDLHQAVRHTGGRATNGG
jgi:hypothetical protein